ncbi:general secretion pathway protein H [Syntrophus gentianae]|uniref:General secretion pathway protein H n=1 Tax=Syntrophus gentianae TaxID=43775 RepID=A0A1H7Z174_9BACT|nr:prepilin-type N-terminal cleavage/methylation domain-containing protein [Syntrophus gentianae]SEM51921.1 general secretion pathway protein H [Syntrophus gentianae]
MNNRAYTLIELIVVLALVSAMLLIALPSLQDTLSAYPVWTEARKLAERIEESRNKASREQMDYTLHVDLEKGLLWTCRRSEPAESQDRSGNSVWTLPKGVRITGIRCGSGEIRKTGESQILFSGQGYAQSAVIYLHRDDLSVSLTVLPFMKAVQIQEESIEDPQESSATDEE